MPSAGFEPSIPTIQGMQTHAFDLRTTGAGFTFPYSVYFAKKPEMEKYFKINGSKFPFLYFALNLLNIQ